MNRSRFNPKRKLREPRLPKEAREELRAQVVYTGNQEHKSHPGDFGLSPPSFPRRDKSRCDDAGVFEKAAAQKLLDSGIQRGLVSSRTGADGRFPHNIWAVSDGGVAFEDQLENPTQGTYHGYPLPEADPLKEQVLDWWEVEDA